MAYRRRPAEPDAGPETRKGKPYAAADMAGVDVGPGLRPVVGEVQSSAGGPGAMPAHGRPGWRRASSVPILLLPIVIVSVCFFPGHMSNDTLAQIGQARDGGFTNQHAPLLIGLWHLVWPLGVGPGSILVVQVTVFVGGTYLILRGLFAGWIAALLTAVIALSPAVFGMLGYLSRDTWSTALLMATFGLLAWSLREGARGSRLLVVSALAASWLTLASRQNAVAAVAVANAAIAWQVLGPRLPRRAFAGLMVVASVGGILTIGMFASQVAVSKLMGVRDVHPEQYVFIYDLELLSHDLHRNLFPADVMPRRDLATIEQYYNIDSVNPLLFSPDPPVRSPLADGPLRSLRRAWKRSIADQPVDYLKGRWRLWLRQVSLTREADFIYHPVVDPNPWGLQVRFASLDEAAGDYVEFFADPRTLDGGPLHRVWVYLLLDVVGALALIRKKMRPAQRVVAMLALAVVAHQAGLFLGAMGTQYRFQFPAVVVGLVVLFVLIQHLSRMRRARPDRDLATPSAV